MINKFKRIFSVLVALSFLLCAVSSASAKGIVTLRTFWDEASQTYKIGSKADFLGHNWTLWNVDDTYAYVITTNSLRKSIFDNDEVVYADSEVRRVVNGYENEMKNYSGGGKSATDTLTWSIINGGDANYIANSPTTEDGVGTDHLYLLSYSDAHFLKDSADPDKNAICKTGYNWWLRTARRSGSALRIYNIYSDGKLIDDHAWFTRGVRPALKINLASPMLSAVRFQTAAEGGKSDVYVGSGFTLADYDGSAGWKLTMKDENIATPEITLTYTGNSGEKLAVDYRNAPTGENMYLSALLYDGTGQLINYAKVVDTRFSGSGRAEIPLYNLPAGNYRIRFFCEEINDGIQPDYASEPSREFAIKSSGMFKTLNDLPKLAGNSSTTVLYDGKRWAKLSDTRLLMVDTLGVKSWNDAVSCGKTYAAGITDTFESKIGKSSALLTTEEAKTLMQSERCFSNYWWLSTNNNSRVPYGVSGMGEIVTMRNRSTAATRPALTLGNTDDIWFLSAVHGAKSAAPGTLVVTPESGKEWRITYKDKTLPAPVFGGELTLDAKGYSKWSNPSDERIAALIGTDGADAKGYLLMRDKGESGGGEILLNGVTGENVYIHTEIIAPGYDRMSAEYAQLADLRYKNGYICGMTLEKKHSGAENPVTLKNGFELSLVNRQLYAQDITSETGTNVLKGTGEQGAKLLGDLTVKGGSQLNCKGKLEFTTMQLDGILVIRDGATVTLTSRPSGTLTSQPSGTTEYPLQVEENGIIANRGTEPIDVYDSVKQSKVTVYPGYYYIGGPEDYEIKKIDWRDPQWEDVNGGGGSDNSSSGCNMGFGVSAMLCIIGLFCKRDNK